MSTAATGVFAAIGSVIAYRSYKRDIAAGFPRVEPDLKWSHDEVLGSYVGVQIFLVNRLDETLEITSAAVRKPRRSKISLGEWKVNKTGFNSYYATKAKGNNVEMKAEVSEAGSGWNDAGPFGRADRTQLRFCVYPPRRWLGGSLRIDLRISSKALTIRDKRIVVQRRLAPKTSSIKDDVAKSTG